MLRNIQDWWISANGSLSESKLELADIKNMTLKMVLVDFNFVNISPFFLMSNLVLTDSIIQKCYRVFFFPWKVRQTCYSDQKA